MPASEETYRRQPTLHIVFAISSIAMTLAIIWMIMADHLRPWKQVQREFHVVEREKLKAVEQATLQKRKGDVDNKISEIDRKINEAEQGAAQREADLNRLEKELKGLQARTEPWIPSEGSRRPSSIACAACMTARSSAAMNARAQVSEHDSLQRRGATGPPLARA